jgi:hypothetical protein
MKDSIAACTNKKGKTNQTKIVVVQGIQEKLSNIQGNFATSQINMFLVKVFSSVIETKK